MTHLNYCLKKLGKTFKLQKELLKTEMNHDEVYSDTWKDKKSEWLDYGKNDVLCTVFCYARYSKAMEEITGFSMKVTTRTKMELKKMSLYTFIMRNT